MSGDYTDVGQGIYAASAAISVDGFSLSGCTASTSSISCQYSGLSVGPHTYTVSVSDWAGNTSSSTQSFIYGDWSPPPPPPPAAVIPHGGYGTGNAPAGERTDLCLSCHDIHQAAGDYALMREASVTATCNTCHGLFGVASDGTWTEEPVALVDGTQALTSGVSAYENTGAARVSGHRLGVSLTDTANNHADDTIPGSNLALRVMNSAAYEEGDIYTGESVLEYGATNGLYCASCHTPHGSVGGVDTNADGVVDSPKPIDNWNSAGTAVTSQAYFGDQLITNEVNHSGVLQEKVKAQKLISSNPNHMLERHLYREESAGGTACAADASAVTVPGDDGLIDNNLCDKFMQVDHNEEITSYNNWCLSCHNKQWNGSEWEGAEMHGVPEGGNNHPPLCVSCHSSSGGNKGVKDFPHTSGNVKLVSKDHDGMCLGCHSSGRLP
jgi:predicted CXXCH cytochrome family protein